MRYALQRAADAAEVAAKATTDEERHTWLSIERGWLLLAYLTGRVGAFVTETDRRPSELEIVKAPDRGAGKCACPSNAHPEPAPVRRNEIVRYKGGGTA